MFREKSTAFISFLLPFRLDDSLILVVLKVLNIYFSELRIQICQTFFEDNDC